MYTGSLDPVSNNETWELTFSFIDTESGEIIDFTGCLIELDLRDDNKCTLLSASTDDGKIVLVEPTVGQLTITKDTMAQFCAGTYLVRMRASRDGRYASLINGSLPVVG